MPAPLFTEDEATDPAYVNIRAAGNDRLKTARFHCEYLWKFFEHHADPEFRTELRSNFDARYWEMYLTTALILAGHGVTCPKPGPDAGVIYRGQRIWFEATSPTGGSPDAPDYIAPPELGKVYDVPQEKIILRYLSSISDKYERQYRNWLAKGIVSDKDAFVIALNPRSIPFDQADTKPPRILQAAYTVGVPYVVIDRDTSKAVGSGYHFRNEIAKASGAKVATGVFQREDYGRPQRFTVLACRCRKPPRRNG
jgi:hypothetical protein